MKKLILIPILLTFACSPKIELTCVSVDNVKYTSQYGTIANYTFKDKEGNLYRRADLNLKFKIKQPYKLKRSYLNSNLK